MLIILYFEVPLYIGSDFVVNVESGNLVNDKPIIHIMWTDLLVNNLVKRSGSAPTQTKPS